MTACLVCNSCHSWLSRQWDYQDEPQNRQFRKSRFKNQFKEFIYYMSEITFYFLSAQCSSHLWEWWEVSASIWRHLESKWAVFWFSQPSASQSRDDLINMFNPHGQIFQNCLSNNWFQFLISTCHVLLRHKSMFLSKIIPVTDFCSTMENQETILKFKEAVKERKTYYHCTAFFF